MIKRVFTRKTLWPFLRDSLSIFGLVEVVLTITGAFDSLKQINSSFTHSQVSLPAIVIAAVLWGGWRNWPKTVYEYKLSDRDVRIRLVIGDAFKQTGALVVPINNEFDAFLGGSVAASQSIKAQVIARHFGNDQEIFQTKANKALRDPVYVGSKRGTGYLMGTTVAIEQNRHTFYLTANSVKTTGTRVEARDEDVVPTLSGLWVYLARHGSKGEVTIPLIGTGNGRLKMQREEVFKVVVKSFIASCSDKCYCDLLTIVITPDDVARCRIDVDTLSEFLAFSCKYASFRGDQGQPTGTPVQSGAVV